MEQLSESLTTGKIVKLTDNKYRISEPIVINSDDITIDGCGSSIVCDNISESAIKITDSAENVKIKNLRVDVNKKTSKEKINGIEIKEATDTSINNCVIENTPQLAEPGTIDAIGGGSGICVREDAINTNIENSTTRSCGWRGIEVGGKATEILSCTTLSQGDRGISGDVQLPGLEPEFDESAEQLRIDSCFARGGPHPASPIGFTNAKEVRVRNCTTQTASGRRGIAARDSINVEIKNCDLLGNTEDPQEGIYTSSKNATINQNTIVGFRYGIRSSGSNTVITGNMISDCWIGIIKRRFRGNLLSQNQIHDSDLNQIRQLFHEARLFGRRVT